MRPRTFLSGCRRDGDEVLAAGECGFADGNLVGLHHGFAYDGEGFGRTLGVGNYEVGFLEEIRRQFLGIDELGDADCLLCFETEVLDLIGLDDDVFALAVLVAL